MAREEVEFMPSGLVTCFINDVEARILKISPEGFTFRVSEKIQHITSLKIVFYSFDDYRYEELKTYLYSPTFHSMIESTRFYSYNEYPFPSR